MDLIQMRRASNKELVILSLLAARPNMYGLELVHESDGRLKRGTIYVTLGRMEDKGYIKSRPLEDPSISGTPRRVYRMTGLGHSVLVAAVEHEAEALRHYA